MRKTLILILIFALSSALLLSACAPDEPETNSKPDEEIINGTTVNIDSEAINYYSSRHYSLFLDPENGSNYKVYSYSSANDHRPKGYNQSIGSVLAIMMDQHKDDVDAKYTVLIGALQTDEVDVEFIEETTDIEKKHIAEVFINDFRADYNSVAYYAELTAEQINALANNNVKCLYIGGNSKGLPGGDWWETQEGVEAFCNYYGDMFVFDKTSGISWSLGVIAS